MPRELRRRPTMSNTELAPIADTRETEAEEFGPNHHPIESEDDGIDEGFGPTPRPMGCPGVPPPRDLYPHGTHPAPPPAPPPATPPHHGSGKPGRRPLDVNLYATKKTVAQGMMDLALLTANANQLRYVLESGKFGNPGANYYISLTLIGLSIAMQLIIGVALIFLGRYNVSREHHAQKADKLNNWVVLGVFIITVINVFISSFSIEPFHGVDPVLLRKAMDTKMPPADVTERITNIDGL